MGETQFYDVAPENTFSITTFAAWCDSQGAPGSASKSQHPLVISISEKKHKKHNLKSQKPDPAFEMQVGTNFLDLNKEGKINIFLVIHGG